MLDGLDALTQPLAKRNSNENVPFEHITMDLGAFLDSVSGGVYYTYLGSLTTPGEYSLFVPIQLLYLHMIVKGYFKLPEN